MRNADALASEMAAFANAKGGLILIGVADDGSIPGLSRADVGRINQLISNAASHLVRSPLVVKTENVAVGKSRVVIVSPGHPPNNLTVEKIRAGISNIRNPILVSYSETFKNCRRKTSAAGGTGQRRPLGSGRGRAVSIGFLAMVFLRYFGLFLVG